MPITLTDVQDLIEAYAETAESLERNRKFGEGLFGITPGPADDPVERVDLAGLALVEVPQHRRPDIPVLLAAGIGVVPSDAVDEAKEAADIISDRPGGKGCVRKHFEDVMKAQGHWNFDVQLYKNKF